MYRHEAGAATLTGGAHDRDWRRAALGLIGIVAGLALTALALLALAGPPRLPNGLPAWRDVAIILQGSSLPPEVVTYPLLLVAWAAWGWTTVLVAFRLVALGAEAVTHGASWARSLRRASDRVTPIVLRRLVDGAVAAIVVVTLAGRTVPVTAAAAPPVAWSEFREASPALDTLAHARIQAQIHAPSHQASEVPARETMYTVRPNDNLWDIAVRFYGTGYDYKRLIDANVGRPMGDGRVFERTAVIHPGWVLRVPLPAEAVDEVDGVTYYTVQTGDTLQGIAARVMSGEEEWRELFEANRGVSRLSDGRTLTHPDLIWPGLRLRLPFPDAAPAETAVVTVGAADSAAAPAEAQTPATAPEALADDSAPELVQPELGELAAPVATLERGDAASSAAPPVVVWEAPTAGVAARPHSEGATIPLAAGAVVASLGAAAAVAARRATRRRSLTGESVLEGAGLPVGGAAPRNAGSAPEPGFAATEPSRELLHRVHGREVEPAVLVAGQALRYLAEQGLRAVSVVDARQAPPSRGGTQTAPTVSLTLAAGLAELDRVTELAGPLGERLGGTAEAWLTANRDVAIRLSEPRLLAALVPNRGAGGDGGAGDASLGESPWLVPVGVLPGGERLYVNWREAGHVLVAGEPGAGADVVLASLVAGLAGRLDAERFALWTATGGAGGHRLPDVLSDLPHQRRTADGPDAAAQLLDELQEELQRRTRRALPEHGSDGTASGRRWTATEAEPLVVLVLEEFHRVSADAALDQIGRYGASFGLHVLAATTRPGVLDDDALAAFDTRLVLAVADEETSIRLLGDPCAADLPAGHVALRLDGRRPLVMQGLRTPESHLAELVRLLRDPGQPPAVMARTAVASDRMIAPDALPAGDGTTGAPDPAGVPAIVAAGPYPTGVDREPVTDAAPMLLHDGRGPGTATAGERESVALVGAPAQDEEGPAENGDAESAPGDGATGDGTEAAAPLPVERVSPRLQVRCFGGYRVLHGGRPLTAESDGGSHHKSWALLAFLASHPDGTVTKDQLMAALWPESDEDNGGNCLGVTMYWLRRVLMRQVPGLAPTLVRTERAGMCRLDTAVVSSDVHRFVECLEAARKLPTEQAAELLQEAHDLYEGDLLLGVPMRSYGWLHERDDTGPTLVERYRDDFRRATLRLAKHYADTGEVERAVPLYRRLLCDEPTDEEVVRELFHAYARLSDLGALVREEQHLRQALRRAQLAAYGDGAGDTMAAAPQRQTTAAFEKLRAALEQVDQVRVPVEA